MSEVRNIPVGDLRLVVTDAAELAKGTRVADTGGISHLARHENKLFCDAAGSGAAPYKVQIVFGDPPKITGRCSCMASRSRPYCKHAAALLVAWARTPEAFAMAEAPPQAPPGDRAARTAQVKKGKVDASELRKRGIEQAFTLLSELWQTGVSTLAEDRAPQVRDLAASLRELGLRRLSARTLELAALLAQAARRDGSFSAEAYAELYSDMWLTVRKLEKHLGGEALADEHVEELIGKTWTKKDRKPIEGLDLVEYAFLQRTTPDGFVLRESRFLDVASGDHFSEKQILPAMLAKRLPAKPSYRGRRLAGASGTLFPSFAPRRLDLAAPGTMGELDADGLRAVCERALPSMALALAALAERRRDPFAPPAVPVLVRADGVLPTGNRVRLLDAEGGTLFVGGGREEEDALMTALAGVRVLAVFGDVTLDGALPTLLTLAVVGERDGAPVLVPLGGDDASARMEAKQARAASGGGGEGGGAWASTARRSAVSGAATLLGEVRDDLASGFQEGFHTAATQRFVAPLAARLGELSMAKQAEALAAVAEAREPTAALDALVRIHQVLGIALSRLAGAAPVDPTSLVRVPRMPSVAVPRPAEVLAPEVAVAREAAGELHRWERAYHVALHYQAQPPEMLLRGTDRYWGDGFAAPFVIAAASSDPELALASARGLLAESPHHVWMRSASRLARMTAISVLAELGTAEARAPLLAIEPGRVDPHLFAFVRRALAGPLLSTKDVEELGSLAVAGSAKEDRAMAIERLATSAATEGIGAIRAALRDRTLYVRKSAAYALASLGDTGSLDTFTGWLDSEDNEAAKVGAHAIGYLGDLRGVGPVLAALARGFSPAVVGEALQLLGPWVLGPLLDLAERQPEVARRGTVASLVRTFAPGGTAATICEWTAAAGSDPEALARRALLGLDVGSGNPEVGALLTAWLGEHHTATMASGGEAARALEKRVRGIARRTAKAKKAKAEPST